MNRGKNNLKDMDSNKKITYNTYLYFLNKIDSDKVRFHQEYLITLDHLTDQKAKDEAYKHYIKRIEKLEEIKNHLLSACQEVYKNDKEGLKVFWGIKNEDI
jgi:hypothetical protein